MGRRRASPVGTIETICGGHKYEDGVAATEVCLNRIFGVAVDASGRLYISHRFGHRVLVRHADGTLHTLAGTGWEGSTEDDVPALEAALWHPFGIAAGPGGEIYIAQHARVRMVDKSGMITTVVGNGNDVPLPLADIPDDGLPGKEVCLTFPFELMVDAEGRVWISDVAARRVYRFDPSTGLVQLVMSREAGGAYDPTGMAVVGQLLFVADRRLKRMLTMDVSTGELLKGAEVSRGLRWPIVDLPRSLVYDGERYLYLSDEGLNQIFCIDTSEKSFALLAGDGRRGFAGDGGDAKKASFNWPGALALATDGTLYVADCLNYRVRAICPDGKVQTVAGRDIGDGGLAREAWLHRPAGVAADKAGNVYVSDGDHRRVRRIDKKTGRIETFAGCGLSTGGELGRDPTKAALYHPMGLASDAEDNLYIADMKSRCVCKVNRAKNRLDRCVRDGRLRRPVDVAVDGSGKLYIADVDAHVVWQADVDGNVSVFAGKPGDPGYSGDGGPAEEAKLNRPRAVTCGEAGEVYIGDRGNFRVRVVHGGIIATYAGTGEDSVSGDGGPALKAAVRGPTGLVTDDDGNLVLSGQHGRVRVVEKVSGKIKTIAGGDQEGYAGDGGPATKARLNYPAGLAVAAGALYAAEMLNNAVRKVRLR